MEVFLFSDGLKKVMGSLLHACGGVSDTATKVRERLEVFSTHVEVFLMLRLRICSVSPVFSTHVEVFPQAVINIVDASKSSPRMWRCFRQRRLRRPVLPCLLHACGGVSANVTVVSEASVVFSTHVEVFPKAC